MSQQRLPPFNFQLGWHRWNADSLPHDSSRYVLGSASYAPESLSGIDTYTAQATVGDVQKGIHNHKVLALSLSQEITSYLQYLSES